VLHLAAPAVRACGKGRPLGLSTYCRISRVIGVKVTKPAQPRSKMSKKCPLYRLSLSPRPYRAPALQLASLACARAEPSTSPEYASVEIVRAHSSAMTTAAVRSAHAVGLNRWAHSNLVEADLRSSRCIRSSPCPAWYSTSRYARWKCRWTSTALGVRHARVGPTKVPTPCTWGEPGRNRAPRHRQRRRRVR
jgi:hypothetical protein